MAPTYLRWESLAERIIHLTIVPEEMWQMTILVFEIKWNKYKFYYREWNIITLRV
jgi:hypothetical protein